MLGSAVHNEHRLPSQVPRQATPPPSSIIHHTREVFAETPSQGFNEYRAPTNLYEARTIWGSTGLQTIQAACPPARVVYGLHCELTRTYPRDGIAPLFRYTLTKHCRKIDEALTWVRPLHAYQDARKSHHYLKCDSVRCQICRCRFFNVCAGVGRKPPAPAWPWPVHTRCHPTNTTLSNLGVVVITATVVPTTHHASLTTHLLSLSAISTSPAHPLALSTSF